MATLKSFYFSLEIKNPNQKVKALDVEEYERSKENKKPQKKNKLFVQNYFSWTRGKIKFLAISTIILVFLIAGKLFLNHIIATAFLLGCVLFIKKFSGPNLESQALSQDAVIGLLVLGGNDGGQNNSVNLITGELVPM